MLLKIQLLYLVDIQQVQRFWVHLHVATHYPVRESMKKGITRLLENDFTEHSHLARGSPVVPNLSNKSSIQMKKSGCDGLNWTQKVNKETIPKRFLILRQDDVGIKLYGAKKISIGSKQEYLQECFREKEGKGRECLCLILRKV